jgi:hypothetical protein
MPLLRFVDCTAFKSIFTIGYVFLSKEEIVDYIWAMNALLDKCPNCLYLIEKEHRFQQFKIDTHQGISAFGLGISTRMFFHTVRSCSLRVSNLIFL